MKKIQSVANIFACMAVVVTLCVGMQSCGGDDDDEATTPDNENTSGQNSSESDDLIREVWLGANDAGGAGNIWMFSYDSNGKLTSYSSVNQGYDNVSLTTTRDSLFVKIVNSTQKYPLEYKFKLNAAGYTQKTLSGNSTKYDSNGYLLEEWYNGGVNPKTTYTYKDGDLQSARYTSTDSKNDYTDTYRSSTELNDANLNLIPFMHYGSESGSRYALSISDLSGKRSKHLFSYKYHDAPETSVWSGGKKVTTYHWYELDDVTVIRDQKGRIAEIRYIRNYQDRNGKNTSASTKIKVYYEKTVRYWAASDE